MISNEQIKASEVLLTGVNGEDLGVIPTAEARALAKRLKVDLVCTTLMSSPPPCKLIGKGAAKQEQQQQARKQNRQPKLKEVRLTPQIEENDYETKRRQAERLLQSGDSVMLVVSIKAKEGAKAKELLEALTRELSPLGRKQTGIQLSGKQAAVQLDPL